jgi:hypothetical protein
MARWLEGIGEPAFKPVSGGYVFQSPNPWLFARPRYYLVNDTQKAAIGECLRKRAIFALFGLLAFVVAMALAVAAIVYLGLPRLSPLLVGISVAAFMLIPVLIAPHVYLMRMLRPIVRDLPTTDQRITTKEQFAKIAVGAPKWLLYVGMSGGVLMVLGGMLGLYDLASEGGSAGRWTSTVVSTTAGVLMAAYFAYLVIKKKAARAS